MADFSRRTLLAGLLGTTASAAFGQAFRPGRPPGLRSGLRTFALPAVPPVDIAYQEIIRTTASNTPLPRSGRVLGYIVVSGSASLIIQDGASVTSAANYTRDTRSVNSGDVFAYSPPLVMTNGMTLQQTGTCTIDWTFD